MNEREIQILLVEDNPGDARLTMEVLRETHVLNQLNHVSDGVEALAYLRKEQQYSTARRPDLILLDLNLPRKDGRELLAEIKADKLLRRIPVVVLTTSQADDDIFTAYDLAANCYVPKPLKLEDFLKVMRGIQDFWLSIVRLPGD